MRDSPWPAGSEDVAGAILVLSLTRAARLLLRTLDLIANAEPARQMQGEFQLQALLIG